MFKSPTILTIYMQYNWYLTCPAIGKRNRPFLIGKTGLGVPVGVTLQQVWNDTGVEERHPVGRFRYIISLN